MVRRSSEAWTHRMSHSRKSTPPADTADLLAQLRRSRLLDDGQWRRLSEGWPAGFPLAEAVASLVQADLLTPYQGEQVQAGRIGSLRLGTYRILDRLGAGGSGEVFKAEHVLMRRLVALKVFKRGKAYTGCRDEVVTTAGLSHPNLVAAQHATRLRRRLVLVLEYVDGIDLDR